MKSLFSLALLAAALPASAQEAHPAQVALDAARERIAQATQNGFVFSFGDDALGFAGRELGGERVVKGAPYCATAVHETVQALMDGNRIVKKQSTQLCRDGEGRTRREVQREGASPIVYLHDPVARESWILDPEKKTARKLGNLRFSALEAERDAASRQAWGERMRENAERWREWALQVAERAREHAKTAESQAREVEKQAREAAKSAEKQARDAARRAEAAVRGGEPGVVVESEVTVRVPGASEPERRREVRVIRLQDLPPTAPLPPLPPMAPVAPMSPLAPMAPMAPMAPLAPLAELSGFAFHLGALPREGGVTTPLPARDIEGVKAHGERTTWTIPAGKLGNEKPIVISREVWRSPELMLTLLSKDSDPRSGEVSYRLERIKRGEPDAQLMKVPGDYEQPKRAPRTPAPPAAKTS